MRTQGDADVNMLPNRGHPVSYARGVGLSHTCRKHTWAITFPKHTVVGRGLPIVHCGVKNFEAVQPHLVKDADPEILRVERHLRREGVVNEGRDHE